MGHTPVVSLPPELVEVITRLDEHPVIDRVPENHDLVRAHNEGDIPIGQTASLTGLTSGIVYEMVETMYEFPDLGCRLNGAS